MTSESNQSTGLEYKYKLEDFSEENMNWEKFWTLDETVWETPELIDTSR